MVTRFNWAPALVALLTCASVANAGQVKERTKTGPAAISQASSKPVAVNQAAVTPSDRSQPSGGAEDRQSRIAHEPWISAPEGGALSFSVDLEDPHEAHRVLVVYRLQPGAEFQELELQRTADLGYAGNIPGGQIRAGHLDYALELEGADGVRTAVFASRVEPQRVQIRHDRGLIIEEALRKRVGGRTTRIQASADWVDFGKSSLNSDQGGSVDDQYWRTEAEYRYRLLRRVQEFGIRVGALRGSSPVASEDSRSGDPYEVGLNYATPFVQLRAHELLRFEASATVAVTEISFALGGGMEVQIGDPYGTQFVLGASGTQGFGGMGHARLDVRASPRLTLSPDIEVTGQPNADRLGVRLSGQVAYDAGYGFGVAVRGGYQARDAASGGVSMGTSLSYAF